MESLQTKKLSKKLKEYIKEEGGEFIKSIEKNSGEDLYLFKKENKYYLIDKKLRNKFISKEGIYEDLEGTSIYIKKDFDNTPYLVIELSGVTMYLMENGENYKPKNSIEQVKSSLIKILGTFVDNLGIPALFVPKTNSGNNNNLKNNNINYKK